MIRYVLSVVGDPDMFVRVGEDADPYYHELDRATFFEDEWSAEEYAEYHPGLFAIERAELHVVSNSRIIGKKE